MESMTQSPFSEVTQAPADPILGLITENADAASRFVFAGAVDIGHVIAHFDDVDGAVGMKGHGDGGFDERFAGDEFQFEAGLKFESFEGFGGRENRRGWDV